jgi:hypothetical protein
MISAAVIGCPGGRTLCMRQSCCSRCDDNGKTRVQNWMASLTTNNLNALFIQGSFKWKSENFVKWFITKIYTVRWHLSSKWTSPLPHTSYVPLMDKLLGTIRSPLVNTPGNHALRPLPHMIWHDVFSGPYKVKIDWCQTWCVWRTG